MTLKATLAARTRRAAAQQGALAAHDARHRHRRRGGDRHRRDRRRRAHVGAAEHQQPWLQPDRRAARQRHADRRARRLRRRLDANARRRARDREAPGVAAVSPMVRVRTQVVAGENNWQTTIGGVAPTYTFIRSWPHRNRAILQRKRRGVGGEGRRPRADRRRPALSRTANRRSGKPSSSKARRSRSSERSARWGKAVWARTRTTPC